MQPRWRPHYNCLLEHQVGLFTPHRLSSSAQCDGQAFSLQGLPFTTTFQTESTHFHQCKIALFKTCFPTLRCTPRGGCFGNGCCERPQCPNQLVRRSISPGETSWARPSGFEGFLTYRRTPTTFFNETLLVTASIQPCPSPPLMLKFLARASICQAICDAVPHVACVCPRIQRMWRRILSFVTFHM